MSIDRLTLPCHLIPTPRAFTPKKGRIAVSSLLSYRLTTVATRRCLRQHCRHSHLITKNNNLFDLKRGVDESNQRKGQKVIILEEQKK